MIHKIKSLMEVKKYEGALELLEFQIGKEPRNQELFLLMARVFEEQRRFDEALNCYDQALSIERSLLAVQSKAFSLYLYHKRYDEAIELYQEILNSNPADSYVLYSIGEAYLEMGEFDQAISYYEKALLFEEDAEYALDYVLGIKKSTVEKAFAQLNLNKVEEAEPLFREAREVSLTGSNDQYRIAPQDYFQYSDQQDMDPYKKIKYEFAYYEDKIKMGLGEILYQNRQYEAALKTYPLLSSPAHTGTSLLHKANCFIEIGDAINAVSCLKQAAEEGEDVRGKLQYLQTAYQADFMQTPRDLDATFTKVKEQAVYYLRKYTSDQATIDGNLQMLGKTIVSHVEQETYEELTLTLHTDSDDVISLLDSLTIGSVLLSKYQMAPHVYQRWVKRNHHSAHRYLLALEDSFNKIKGEQDVLPFYVQVEGILENKLTGKVEKGYFREGDIIFTGEKSSMKLKEIRMNGEKAEEAGPGQMAEFICAHTLPKDIEIIWKGASKFQIKKVEPVAEKPAEAAKQMITQSPSFEKFQSISKEKRILNYLSEMDALVDHKLGEAALKQKLASLEDQYKINEMDRMIYEAAVLGRIYNTPDFTGKKWEYKRDYFISVLDRVEYLGMKGELLQTILNQLKSLKIIAKGTFYTIEEKLFGCILSMTEAEKEEQHFIEETMKKYRNLESTLFGNEFNSYQYKYFDCGRFIHDFSKQREELEDTLIFSCKENTSFINPKEGFVISSKAIYSYGWTEPVLFEDVVDLQLKDTYDVYVLVKNQAEPKRLYTRNLMNAGKFVLFMKDVLREYIEKNAPDKAMTEIAAAVESVEAPQTDAEVESTKTSIRTNALENSRHGMNPAAASLTTANQTNSKTIVKGSRVELTKLDPNLKNVWVQIGWDPDESLKIDASVFMVGADGKCPDSKSIIFYGNPTAADHSINHSVLTGTAINIDQFDIDINRISSSIDKLVFTLTIDDGEKKGQTFSQMKNGFLKVVDKDSQNELYTYSLGSFTVENAIVLAEVYRKGRDWKLSALTGGFSEGQAKLYEHFGLEGTKKEETEQSGPEKEVKKEPAASSKQQDQESVQERIEKLVTAFYDNLQGYVKDLFYLYRQQDSKSGKKFSNVLSSYAQLENDEQPILLYDNTAFGSAKDGFLITTRHIYWHNLLSFKQKLVLRDIQEVELNKTLKINKRDINIELIPKKNRDQLEKEFKRLFSSIAEIG
ncbi:TerD family protein [Cytobacillus massiliigabonensis]|uniref:TerD family protein n=1 Tax=Cytobacillus massiliigabonensis TaxID=1871011 RepID=UPI000C85A2FE|nr:TerD family protein [Cytobacillus massiliigabonensis]